MSEQASSSKLGVAESDREQWRAAVAGVLSPEDALELVVAPENAKKFGVEIPQEVLDRADEDPAIGRLRTVDLIQSLPGVGEVRAQRVMEVCGISPVRRLKGVGRRQREALIAYIGR